jgi:hypothetical protein
VATTIAAEGSRSGQKFPRNFFGGPVAAANNRYKSSKMSISACSVELERNVAVLLFDRKRILTTICYPFSILVDGGNARRQGLRAARKMRTRRGHPPFN